MTRMCYLHLVTSPQVFSMQRTHRQIAGGLKAESSEFGIYVEDLEGHCTTERGHGVLSETPDWVLRSGRNTSASRETTIEEWSQNCQTFRLPNQLPSTFLSPQFLRVLTGGLAPVQK